ncbi:UNKNOWN [Stylonychia lemnae]|uniref:Transmembrane protein n=1 Tax=Stylonychia lemnae TaxID=5949 RepID=A0A077ZZY4_STYLE|nr:UNKNOWN [Stylonychia lemnae]|eukprot:CDW74083.1 UNKNOWN [Stylonychia lemnae]
MSGNYSQAQKQLFLSILFTLAALSTNVKGDCPAATPPVLKVPHGQYQLNATIYYQQNGGDIQPLIPQDNASLVSIFSVSEDIVGQEIILGVAYIQLEGGYNANLAGIKVDFGELQGDGYINDYIPGIDCCRFNKSQGHIPKDQNYSYYKEQIFNNSVFSEIKQVPASDYLNDSTCYFVFNASFFIELVKTDIKFYVDKEGDLKYILLENEDGVGKIFYIKVLSEGFFQAQYDPDQFKPSKKPKCQRKQCDLIWRSHTFSKGDSFKLQTEIIQ